jgi:uncharacterized protein YigA (DUF484 family)
MKEEFGAILRMRATEVEADNEPGVEQVLAYLARHPDFFLRHDAILAELELPHRAGAAVSLVERQVALLRERNIESRQRLNRLLETARENDELFTKTRRLILALLEAESLERLAQVLVLGLRREFDVEHARLLLVEDAARHWQHGGERIAREAAEAALNGVMRQDKPVSGPLRQQAREALFGTHGDNVLSSVVVTVAHAHPIAIIALGSCDARRFHGEMGTMFMELIGDVLQRLLPRFTGPQ